MVQADSGRVPRAPPYSGFRLPASSFAYGALTLSGRPSDAVPLAFRNDIPAALQPRPCGRFGLLRFRSPLLPESLLLSSPPGTEMFQFPGLHSLAYVFRQRMARVIPAPGFPIRIPTDRCALAAPRGVSPYAASFLSSACQDIRHAPFFV